MTIEPCLQTIYNPDGSIKIQRMIYSISTNNNKDGHRRGIRSSRESSHDNSPMPYPIKPKFKKCFACGTKKGEWHKHHITYKPERIARLCLPCHSIITSLNTAKWEQIKRPLTNKERIYIFKDFVGKKRSKRKFKELDKHLKNGQEIFLSHYKNNAMDAEFLDIVHQ